jgi:hypothetical protein
MLTRRRFISGLLLVASFAFAACGGSSPTASDTPGSSTSPTTSDGGGVLSRADCTATAAAMAVAATGGFGAGSSGADPTNAADALRRAAGGAPAAIKADLELMSTELGKFYAALQAAGVDFNNPSSITADKAQALQAAAAAFESSGAKDASARVTAYFATICPAG